MRTGAFFLLPVTRKFRITIEYDGTAYQGWQVQDSGPTIQGMLQDALHRITGERASVIGSGRTDSGVHAEAQVAHFRTDSGMTAHQFLMAFNSLLPRDIVIRQAAEVAMDFHAQQSAVGKIYRYTILNRTYPSALHFRRSAYVQTALDVEALRAAAALFVGEHDFSAFRAANCEAKTPVREIYRIEVLQAGDVIDLFFEGNGFLKHMVRNLAGTLIWVGRGKLTVDDVRRILASRDRRQAGPTAQPQGLALIRVHYPGEERGPWPPARGPLG